MIVRKSNYSYVLRTESIIVFPNQNPVNQYISFNCYTLQSRKKFYKFKQEIENSKPSEYDNINDIFGLARRYNVPSSGAHKPEFMDGRIAI